MNTQQIRKWVLIGLTVLAVFTVGLGLDLANRGLAWQVFWSLTGEEAPLDQLKGMVEWAGNFTRSQPRTEPFTPVAHAGYSPYGMNVFLEQEVELEKREQIMSMLSEAGFSWIRQQFSWEDIEIHGRGDFEDRRNIDAIGIVSAWDKYDHIVDLANQYNIEIFARLDNPPAWTHENPDIGTSAPPDDLQDYINFVRTIADRYKDSIRYYQIWNEPNIYPEWGNQDVSPEAYTEMLCQAYDAIKAVDENIVVSTGALAPTFSLTGRDLSDTIFLQRMYNAGAKDCFDVLSVQGYGFYTGPTDQRMRPTTLNFSHHLYIRDMMIANDDANKAIWVSEAAWNPIDSPEVPADVSGRENYGVVTQEQAARYMPLGYQRAQEDWPWVGPMFYWFFKRPADFESGQSWYYFRMVEPDFTPLPVYDSMREYIQNQQPMLYSGLHQAEHWAVTVAEDAALVDDPAGEAELGQYVQTDSAQFTTHGTEVMIRYVSPEPLTLRVDDGPEQRIAANTRGEFHFSLQHSLLPQTHTFTITGPTDFYLDSITVENNSVRKIAVIIGALLIFSRMFLWIARNARQARHK